MKQSDLWMVLGLALLFLVLAASFLDQPWRNDQAVVGASGDGSPADTSVARALFGEYAFALPLLALLLGACMIGGVYLAKTEGEE